MRLSQIPRKFYKHIHPSFRFPLLRGRKNRRRILKRDARALILRKYSIYDIKPRIPPLHCARCGLATRNLHTISYHDCTLKNIHIWRGTGNGACAELNTLGDDEIDEDLLAQGGRNRMRDGMGILERFARPQNVAMYDIHFDEPDEALAQLPLSTGRSVPTLSELVMRVVAPPRPSSNSVPSEEVFEKKEVEIVSKRKIGKGRLDGHFCPPCGRLFASFSDYDEHLEPSTEEREEKNPCRIVIPDPIPILINDRGNAPAELDFSVRRSKKRSAPLIIDPCTGCGMNEFESKIDLHTHIVECAKRMEYDRIEEAINKRRHLIHTL
ncbi:hypothetical protein PFISCL1PPCAC_5903 [Pristionchus fissidentatus]|uniref:C2H2-type domain-containing protein n=1 Tax=Pristionchus fissidentatus TaxID=1538716 RepID=A0AAV5V5H6_9BILA|nr:hypothetical protein PFISCL1PPCAC_5903 [Pristionchus fissidentatus]